MVRAKDMLELGKNGILGVFFGLFVACQGAGESLSTQASVQRSTESSQKKQELFFSEAAAHIVGAFEKLQKLDTHYDETGYCGPDCSIWLFKAENPSVRYHLTRFDNIGEPGATGADVGRYIGYAEFTSAHPPYKRIRIDLNFLYSGEDYTVDVKVHAL